MTAATARYSSDLTNFAEATPMVTHRDAYVSELHKLFRIYNHGMQIIKILLTQSKFTTQINN